MAPQKHQPDFEVPDADRLEQLAAVADEPDSTAEEHPDRVSGRVEANEADLLDQEIPVPFDDE